MKKNRVAITIVGLVILYIIVLIIGLSIMIGSSMRTQKADWITAPIIIGNIEEFEQDPSMIAHDSMAHIQVYDSKGNFKYNSDENPTRGGAVDRYDYDCQPFVKEIINKKNVLQKFRLVSDDAAGDLRVVYIYGAPLIHENEIIGAVFDVHSPLYFSRTLKVFLIFFSGAYIVAAAAVVIVMITRYRYEDARKKYIDNVTHALKTPVTAIKALAETLYDNVEQDPEEQRLDLELILQQANLQVEMVQNILNLSRIQTYGAKVQKIRLNPEEILLDPIKKHLPVCEQKKITITVTDSYKNLPDLYTDPDAIRQIIDVVLDNSVKFTGEGGSIVIDAKTTGKKAIVEIRDNGIGIDADKIGEIFDRFYTSSVGNTEGHGLGLAIAKELTKSLHEKIWAESKPDGGTSVFFTIKLAG